MTGGSEVARSISVRMLGPMDVSIDDEALRPLRSRKGAWLLALLALRGGREVERDWLEAVLWPDSPSEKASASLRQSLTDLRRALGRQAYRLESPSPRTLRLDVDASDVDVLAFDAALARGDRASLDEATALYRGVLLEGCAEEWVAQERDHREEAFLSALETAASHDIAHGDAQRAIGRLRRAVAINPLRETAQRALMEALAGIGDLSAAIVVYRDLRLHLRRELNADPDPQTAELYERIRSGARCRAEQGAQPRANEPPAPAQRRPRLPQPLTPLIGRDQHAAEALEALAASRLVTLVGPGGVGKTRLAISLAHRLLPSTPDGVWFVDLSGLADGSLLAPAIASELGVHDLPGQSIESAIATELQDLSVLLVVDNCEHLVEPCARVLGVLLAGCPGLRILATSRQPLEVAGEFTYRVPALSVPDPGLARRLAGRRDSGLDELLTYDAIRLFVERARAVHGGFSLTPETGAIVSEIAARLDGLPLAIELAAARVRAMPIDQIASRLDDRFRLLTSSTRDKPARHQALRTAMDWSYELLDEEERALLRRLAVFASGWTCEAAEEVCTGGAAPSVQIDPGAILDLLTELVDRSLVSFDLDQNRGRYRLLETVRAYARAQLEESGEAPAVRDRHLAYYIRMVEAGGRLEGAQQAAWFDAMERDHANIGAALEWCVATGQAEVGLRLAACLGPYWAAHGHRAEGRERLSRALASAASEPRSVLHCQALLRAADLAWGQGDHVAAGSYAKDSLAIARETGYAHGVALSLAMLGQTALGQGSAVEARHYHEEGLALFRSLGDTRAVAATLLNLGEAARLQGDGEAAVRLYDEGRTVAREAGIVLCEAVCEANLAALAIERGDLDVGRALLIKATRGLIDLGNHWLVTLAIPSFASLALALGDAPRAARLLGAADALCQSTGSAIQPADRVAYAEAMAKAKAACGGSVYEAEWAKGAEMTMDEATRLVMEG